jgi:predicted dehydrogenase
VADAAREAARVCMPAMCVRFWPGWADLKAWIERPVRGAGALRSLSIQRLGMMPTWGEFYRDFKRSGGVLGDLHLHDTDFVTWCLGLPRAVFTTGSMMHLTTCYLYDGLHVTAEGGWDHRGEFVMQYTAEFEEATMSWVLGREPAMLMESDLALMDGEASELSGWDLEIRHLLDVIACGADQVATMEEAVETMRVIEAERRSLGMGRVVEMSEVD